MPNAVFKVTLYFEAEYLIRVYTKTAHRQNGPDQNGPKNFNF